MTRLDLTLILQKITDRASYSFSRSSMRNSLKVFLANGPIPNTVIDVGAAYGTPDLYSNFPDAHLVFLEPLKEFQYDLQSIKDSRGKCTIIQAGASSKTGKGLINVHSDLVGSSVFFERNEEVDINGIQREIDFIRLDEMAIDLRLEPPYLIKVDTQGSEMNVIEGASSILESTCGIIMELSLFEFFEKAPLFHEVVTYMQSLEFIVYDIVELKYRPYDSALGQVDVLFVPINSNQRKFQGYASPEQRIRVNSQIKQFLRGKKIV
jgi:FkbM family methyltransferase